MHTAPNLAIGGAAVADEEDVAVDRLLHRAVKKLSCEKHGDAVQAHPRRPEQPHAHSFQAVHHLGGCLLTSAREQSREGPCSFMAILDVTYEARRS